MQVISKFDYTFKTHGEPAAYADPGETLKFLLRDCNDGQIQREDQLSEVDWEKTNPATGPVYINGAEPGDVIAVDILDISVDDHGVTSTIQDLGPLWPRCEHRTRRIEIQDGCALFNDIRFPIAPMIGVIGTALPDRDIASGSVHEGGGNMDSAIITKGTTVWLPVRVPGGLLQMGDIHAAMGDGEVVGNGIEIAGEVIARVRLVKRFLLNYPVTETKDAWYVNTFGPDCDTAIQRGYLEMHRLLMAAYGWDSTDTAIYMSIQGQLCANQACLVSDDGGDTFRIGTPKVTGKPPLVG